MHSGVGAELPIHRPCRTTGTLVMVLGKLMEHFYNGKGELTGKILLEADGERPVLPIPVGPMALP